MILRKVTFSALLLAYMVLSDLPFHDPSADRTGVSMYAVPLLVTNYQSINNQYPNAGKTYLNSII